jgi:hypothetical protein
MEGELYKHVGFVRGFKKHYAKLGKGIFIVQKGKTNKKDKIKLDLREDISVEPFNKEVSEFIITYNLNNKKP